MNQTNKISEFKGKKIVKLSPQETKLAALEDENTDLRYQLTQANSAHADNVHKILRLSTHRMDELNRKISEMENQNLSLQILNQFALGTMLNQFSHLKTATDRELGIERCMSRYKPNTPEHQLCLALLTTLKDNEGKLPLELDQPAIDLSTKGMFNEKELKNAEAETRVQEKK